MCSYMFICIPIRIIHIYIYILFGVLEFSEARPEVVQGDLAHGRERPREGACNML